MWASTSEIRGFCCAAGTLQKFSVHVRPLVFGQAPHHVPSLALSPPALHKLLPALLREAWVALTVQESGASAPTALGCTSGEASSRPLWPCHDLSEAWPSKVPVPIARLQEAIGVKRAFLGHPVLLPASPKPGQVGAVTDCFCLSSEHLIVSQRM